MDGTQLSLIPQHPIEFQQFVKSAQRKKIHGFIECGYQISNIKQTIAGGITLEVYGFSRRSHDGRVYETYWAEYHLNQYGGIQSKRVLLNERTYTDHDLNPIKRECI